MRADADPDGMGVLGWSRAWAWAWGGGFGGRGGNGGRSFMRQGRRRVRGGRARQAAKAVAMVL